MPEAEAKQKRRGDHTLQQKTNARPAVWKYGEETLQEPPFSVLSLGLLATSSKGPKEGLSPLLSGDLQFDHSSPQTDRHSMSPVSGVEL